MCDHKNIVLLPNGWFCPDCGEYFNEKPKAKKPEEAKSKKKQVEK